MSRLRLPHPAVLVLIGIGLAALLTWILPSGEFERREDPATGRRVVVAGTYHAVPATPVGPLGAILSVPRGLLDAADIMIAVFFVGGAFALVEQLGTLQRGAVTLARRFSQRGLWAIPFITLPFALLGALENMQEEIIPLVPVLLILGRALGVDAVTMVAVSMGGAAIGSAFSPINPFQAGLALRLAQLPPLSGGALRLVMLGVALALWIAWTMRYAARNLVEPDVQTEVATQVLTRRDVAILALLAVPLGAYVYGALQLGWGFNELSAVFFAAAIVVGLIGGLGMSGTMRAYLAGMHSLVPATVLIGMARSISVVLGDGHVIDTIVRGLAAPLTKVPATVAALGMVPLHGLLHIAVPSVSGQAVLTLPVLIPLSDLLGLTRQATVLAYQTGAGLMDAVTPTNGALMAILLAAGVSWSNWMSFMLRGGALMLAVGAAGILAAALLGL
ncbi:MAG: YfcC family protein [Gemmatimonadaceae bacterium]